MKYANRVVVEKDGKEIHSAPCWGLGDTVETFARLVQNHLSATVDGCALYTLEEWGAERAVFSDNWEGGTIAVEIK